MPADIRRIQKSELTILEGVIRNTIDTLSYYNAVARKNEIGKYTAVEMLNKIDLDPDAVLVALDDEKIIGFCLSRMDDMILWLEWFGVLETNRRKGVGKQLVKYLESTAKNRNAHKIWCDCRTENIKSINLLSSIGFLPICTIKNHWYGQDFILWQKEIF